MYALVNLWMVATAMTSVFLLNAGPTRARWGAVVGLLGQPAWLYLTVALDAPGMFWVSVFFTACYGRGVWDGFVRRGARHG
ncbi:hypothetical protein [Cupriavidus pinatubonensis]|uniref:hypothetical protein n=1 Tax=Cupriavidus pinatubonensis TaxID=248026 RepID=UPI0036147933